MSRQPIWRHSEHVRPALALLFFVGFTFLLAAGLPPTSNARLGPPQVNGEVKTGKPEFVPGEVLVRYHSEEVARRETSLANLTGVSAITEEGRQLPLRLERFEGSEIVPGLRIAHVAAEDTMAAIEALRKQPNVVYAEPNYLLHTDTIPNDPRFLSNELYGLTKIAAPSAWDTTQGSASVVVGVIDEGIDKLHEDLQANIWINPGETAGNGIDDDGNGFIDDVNGYNFPANTGTIPADFHGTHVGGTVGAVGNNGIGVVGVNWNVRLMSLKFIDDGLGSTADAIRACNYAKQMRDTWVSSNGSQGANLRVLNNSYGGGGFSQSFLDAINSLNSSGILFVVSAGNVDGLTPEPNNEIVAHYPSSYLAPNVIGVAATDSTDSLPSYSHYGLTTIHLGAPGSGILSTTPGNNYALSNGTSMATPHVTGTAALLLAQNPNLTVQQLKSLLIYNGDSAAALLNKTITGRRLNAFKSLQALAESDVTPPGTVVGLHVNTQTGRSINLGWTASGDDGATGQASLYQLTFTDATTGAVIPLPNVPPATSGTVQALDINLPYRHTSGTITLREFDNAGNEGTAATLPVSVSKLLGDPYVTSLGSPVALTSGGTPLALNGDDKLRLNYALPFSFPFFGQNFSTVNISTNGNLFFSTPPTRTNGDADDVPSSVVNLARYKMISGLWDDLRTDHGFGSDVYVDSNASRIIFRWQGVTFGDGTPATEFPVNFEVELRVDGTILTRYGSGNTNIFPVVGISGGEPEAYSIPSHTSEQVAISLTNAQQVTFTPRRTLTVASFNPASGVAITVTPADDDGLANGTTQFVRTYVQGTVVNLTAPATASGNNFVKWQRDGVDVATTLATSVTIDETSHTMTAVYVTPRVLTVASSNPGSGVTVTVTPNDNFGAGSGTTQFTRTYNEGATVNLTAPVIAGRNFLKWQKDGTDFANSAATSVTIGAALTMTAIYVTTPTLAVGSSNPASGVEITVTPADLGGVGDGQTAFARTYVADTDVTLTAPATALGNNFLKWQKDGSDFAGGTSASVIVKIDANHTMTAVYSTPRILTVSSSNPDGSGVLITVTPADRAGSSNGTTQFTRTYNDGTTVNLTAPATADGNNFLKWQRGGLDFATTASTIVTMDAPYTMTAVYITPRTLDVASLNPASGVNITVTPADRGGLSNGPTPFSRIYNDGTVVDLTAPATASGNNFIKWQKNGNDFSGGNTAAISLPMNANFTMTAVYVTPRTLTVASRLPASGVSIVVAPNDLGGLNNGTTEFTRSYNEGTIVSLTAPASVSGNPFLLWERDGVSWANTPGTTVTLDGVNRTMTAVYTNSVQFSLPQFSAFEPLSPPCTGSPACEGSATVTVSRSSTTTTASVDYTTSDDVATQKGDYIFRAGRLDFAIGEASKSFTVFIVDDVFIEGTEKFKVMLSNPVGTSLGFRSVADVAIFDNDGSPHTNPLDNADARFFVRQHYLDFLNREPDSSGLDFWRNQITSCGTDQACIELRRINVSAAFFLSIEFQETGYLVERLYKAAYADASGTSTFNGSHQLPVPVVRFTEFMTDSQEIGRGVVIGQPGADQLLESNKQAFIAAFVQRSRFTTNYPTVSTPAQYVDALFANAGVTPSATERTAAINEFNGAGNTVDTAARARALRRVAENSTLTNNEKNKAFVLMQYFGYLRRDPNGGQDTDYTGYDFWLSKLVQFNGNFVNAEMVKAFITSGEYRQRFGP